MIAALGFGSKLGKRKEIGEELEKRAHCIPNFNGREVVSLPLAEEDTTDGRQLFIFRWNLRTRTRTYVYEFYVYARGPPATFSLLHHEAASSYSRNFWCLVGPASHQFKPPTRKLFREFRRNK